MIRLLELCISLGSLLALSPIAAFLLVANQVQDGGSLFFRQVRLGKHRRRFPILKFRTMAEGKVTPLGHWLRPTGLDELAQFYNVLRGEMRLCGPRPLTENDVAHLGWENSDYDQRWAMEPGMTCIAGIFGSKNGRHAWRMDLLYARRQSPLLDLQLVGITFSMLFFGKRRVRRWLRRIRRWRAAVRRRETIPLKRASVADGERAIL